MKYRKLRIAWSVLRGIVAILFISLWLRSYWRNDVFLPRFTSGTALSRGQLYFSADCAWRDPHTRSLRLAGRTYELMIVDIWAPYDSSIDIMRYGSRLPLWPAVVVLPLAAVAPWLKSIVKMQFSLRALLIAATLVSLALYLLSITMR